MEYIKSYTMENVLDARDGNFIHHDQYTSQLEEPEIKYCYANTIVLEVKSSHYNDPKYVNKKTGKSKGYGLKYNVFILLEDFYTIAKDKDIDFHEAVDYAIRYGDIHVRCNCPAFLFWGYAYISTQLRYLYGLPRENRSPKIRNPNMKGTICKHSDKAITYCLQNVKLIEKMFETYYDRFNSGDKLIAIDSTGKPVTIGYKNGDGDVFFENQLLKEQEHEEWKKHQESEEENDIEIEEENNEQETDSNESIDDMNPDTWWDEESEDDENVIEGEEDERE